MPDSSIERDGLLRSLGLAFLAGMEARVVEVTDEMVERHALYLHGPEWNLCTKAALAERLANSRAALEVAIRAPEVRA